MAAPSSNTPSATVAAGSKVQAAGTDNGVVPSDDSTREEPFAENGDPFAATEPFANGKGGMLEKDISTSELPFTDPDGKIQARAGASGGLNSSCFNSANGECGGLKKVISAPEVVTTDAHMSQAQAGADGGVKASYCSAHDKTGGSGTTIRGIFSKVLTPARATFALLTMLVLWSSADRPERVMWIFSAIACSYLALWTIYLTAAIGDITVLVSVSYIALVAGCITHFSSAAGIFIMLLNMGYTAGLFGYALSEYRQRKGTECSAEHVPTRSEEELKEDRSLFNMMSSYASVVSLACAAGATWLVVCFTLDTGVLVVALSLLINLPVFFWTCLVTLNLLHGALVAADLVVWMYVISMVLFLPEFLLSFIFGNTIGMLVHPIGVMSQAGFLGYSLGVYARFKDMKKTLEGKKKD